MRGVPDRLGDAVGGEGTVARQGEGFVIAINLAKNHGLWLWVPAFAGTTRRGMLALDLLRQRDHDAPPFLPICS